jgi:hypothetical protein
MKRSIHCALAFAVAAVLWPAPAAHAQEGLQLLPADTPAILTLRSIEKLYRTFGVEEVRKEHPDQFLAMKEKMVDEIGVDLFDLAGLRAFGLDPEKPIYLGLIAEPSLAMALLLPTTGDAKSFIESLREMQGAEFTQSAQEKGVEIYGNEDETAAVYAKGSYVAAVLVDEDESDLPAIEAARHVIAAAQKGTMKDSKPYEKALKKIPGEADLAMYLGPGLYGRLLDLKDSGMEDEGVSAEEVKALYDKWGISDTWTIAKTTLESKRLVTESFTWINKDSEILGWYRVSTDPVAFLNRVPSDPMLAVVGRVNFAKVWESIRQFDDVMESDSIPDLEEKLDEASGDIGVDIVDDLIDQFNGNLVLLINQIQMMNTDAVILMQLSRPEEFQATMTSLVEEIDASIEVNPSEQSGKPNPELERDEYQGVPYYTFRVPPMVEVSFGVVEDHLVVASPQMRFQSIVQGDGSFIESIGNKEIRQTLDKKTGNAFYMDFQKIAANLQAWAPMLGDKDVYEWIDVLNGMKDLVSVSRLEDDGVRQKITFTGARPDMWKRLLAAWVEKASEHIDIEKGDNPENDSEAD